MDPVKLVWWGWSWVRFRLPRPSRRWILCLRNPKGLELRPLRRNVTLARWLETRSREPFGSLEN